MRRHERCAADHKACELFCFYVCMYCMLVCRRDSNCWDPFLCDLNIHHEDRDNIAFSVYLNHSGWRWHTKSVGLPTHGAYGYELLCKESHFLSTILFWIVKAKLAIHMPFCIILKGTLNVTFPTQVLPQVAIQKSLACLAVMKWLFSGLI